MGSTDLSASYPYTEVQVGDNADSDYQNLFDELQYGIYGLFSNLTSLNNAFTRCKKGIYAESYINPGILSLPTFYARLRIWDSSGSYHNRFYDCSAAVEGKDLYEISGEQAYMISSHSTGAASENYGYNLYSDVGWKSVNIHNDTIVNISYPALVKPMTVFYQGQLMQPVVHINHNEIRATIPGGKYDTALHPNRYVKCGIQVLSLVSQFVGLGHLVSIDSNWLMDVQRGILANALMREEVSSRVNNIVLVRDTAQHTQYGIWHADCWSDTIQENPNVHGLNIMGSGYEDSVKAYLVSSSSANVNCNWEDSVGRGFEFAGYSSGTAWYSNTMDSNLEGMYLNNGIIDTQGNATLPTGNNWNGYWGGSHYATYVFGNPAGSASALYIDSAGAPYYYPANNFATPPVNNYNNGGLLTANGVAPSCGPRPPYWNYLAPYHNLAWANVDYGSNTAIRTWIGQYQLWQMLQTDSALLDSSAILQTFVTLGATSRFNYMSQIENYIATGDLTTAYSMASTCPSPNPQYDPGTAVVIADSSGATHVVAKYLKFYKILIHYLDGTISDAEKDTLTSMAGLCPILNGMVVYQARSLYAIVYNTANTFDDASCDAGSDRKPARQNNGSQPIVHNEPDKMFATQQQYSVYPNPNNGSMVLLQREIDNNPVVIKIINVLGQIVYQNESHFTSGKSIVNLKNQTLGLYTIQLTDSNGHVFLFKFIISE